MSGFYANELLIKLLPRNDPHPDLYQAYAALLEALAGESADPVRALRVFEKRLLENLGWGLNLEQAGNDRALDAQCRYYYRLESGPEAVDGAAEGSLVFSGASLLSLAREELADPRSLADARRLLRAALDHCLDGRPLRTREVLLAMRAHGAGMTGG
jgi:DNA repair protein RecO (recombination protein O)